MENKIARIISYLFHPIFLPVYCLLFLFNLKAYFTFEIIFKARFIMMAFVTVTTIIFPLLIIYLMKRQGFIQSFKMETLQERRVPYMIMVIFYFLTYNMFRQMELPWMYTNYMLGATILLSIVVVVNFWWKISTHMIGIGGVFGVITGMAIKLDFDLMFLIVLVTILAGIIGYARLKLNAHTPAEIYTGFLAGAIVMTGIFCFL